jgi:Holliday junction resolvasome RuvABC endonuclease subunit
MILGLDLSLRATGYAVLNDEKVILDYGCIEIDTDNDIEIYSEINEKIKKIFDDNIIEDVFIEEMFIRSPKIAMRLGKLHGYILNTIKEKYSLDANYINIMTIKKHITGNGHAKKEKVFKCLSERYPVFCKKIGFHTSTAVTKGRYKTDDIVDAIAIALTGMEGAE